MSDRAISSALAALGFDGILYVNKFEGEQPAPSIIVFDAGRLTIVDREIVPPQDPD